MRDEKGKDELHLSKADSHVFEPVKITINKDSSSPSGEIYDKLDEISQQQTAYEIYKKGLMRSSVSSRDGSIDSDKIKQDFDDEIMKAVEISRPRYEAAVKRPLNEMREDIERKQAKAICCSNFLRVIWYTSSLFVIIASATITVFGALKEDPISRASAILGGIITGLETVMLMFQPEQRANSYFNASTSYSRIKAEIYDFYLDPPDDTKKLKTFMRRLHNMHEEAARGFSQAMNTNNILHRDGKDLMVKQLEEVKIE